MSEPNKKEILTEKLPSFCDYTCKHAAFADPSSIGACRKDLAVWCNYVKRYNNKNNKCLGK